MTTKFSDTKVTDSMTKVKVPKVKVPLRFGEYRKLLDEQLYKDYWKYIEDLEKGFLDENIYKFRLNKDEGPEEYWRDYIDNANFAIEAYFPYDVEDYVKSFVVWNKVPAKLIKPLERYASLVNDLWGERMGEFLEVAESTLDGLYGERVVVWEDEDEE